MSRSVSWKLRTRAERRNRWRARCRRQLLNALGSRRQAARRRIAQQWGIALRSLAHGIAVYIQPTGNGPLLPGATEEPAR